jgi:hypothetical protein
MSGTKFTIDAAADEGCYVTIAEDVTIYEDYDDAVAEIQDKLSTDTESFLAKVTIEANGEDDVALALEQVGWQQVIRDMATKGEDSQ